MVRMVLNPPKKLKQFLPRITHTAVFCATFANCILEFPQIPIKARFLSLIDRIGQRGTVSSSSCIQQIALEENRPSNEDFLELLEGLVMHILLLPIKSKPQEQQESH